MALQSNGDRSVHGIDQHDNVLAGRFRVEEETRPSGNPGPLDERPSLVADHENEALPGFRSFDLRVNLARRRIQTKVEADARPRLDDHVLGELREFQGHGELSTRW